MLAQRLLRFRPAPIVAMTATATPLVQKDIAMQLDLRKPKLHIHGFRRTNIAIEISEVALPDRPALARKLLSRESARPAIVYAPTRKDTESIAEALQSIGRVSPYHAGLSHEKRQGIQRDFQAGKLDVIVATIAFGMGIDKSDIRTVVHAALPSSVEAYYQEIGRAGRDGKFSRAILMHSYADHRTREFFIKKNYPDIKVLEGVLKKIPREGVARPDIRSSMDASTLDNALEKLWVHGAIEIDGNDEVRSLPKAWQKSYLDQQIHKEAEVSLMSNFAQNATSCRMLLFLHHFGDVSDKQEGCGICDFCLPLGSLSKSFRQPNAREQAVMVGLLKLLDLQTRSMSISKAFQNLEASLLVSDRKLFDACADTLIRQGAVTAKMESFEKDGQPIIYKSLTAVGPFLEEPNWDDYLILESQATSEVKTYAPRKSKAKSKTKTPRQGASRSKGSSQSIDEIDDPLAQKLRGWRLRTAKKEKVPAYRVFSDKTLSAL
ncbi:MAG: ATP-dependent DNA helicase RecQ, partial [Proteobacteria bacterium]